MSTALAPNAAAASLRSARPEGMTSRTAPPALVPGGAASISLAVRCAMRSCSCSRRRCLFAWGSLGRRGQRCVYACTCRLITAPHPGQGVRSRRSWRHGRSLCGRGTLRGAGAPGVRLDASMSGHPPVIFFGCVSTMFVMCAVSMLCRCSPHPSERTPDYLRVADSAGRPDTCDDHVGRIDDNNSWFARGSKGARTAGCDSVTV